MMSSPHRGRQTKKIWSKIRFPTNPNPSHLRIYFPLSISKKDIDVFKLDYDSPENPLLIRIILDEMVEVTQYEISWQGYFACFAVKTP